MLIVDNASLVADEFDNDINPGNISTIDIMPEQIEPVTNRKDVFKNFFILKSFFSVI